MKIALLLLLPLTLYGLYVIGVILFGTLNDYKPEEKMVVEVQSNSELAASDSTFSFLLWNIGYGGLGAESDFFYDGGKMVRPEKYLVEDYVKGITESIKGYSDVDFVLLQEVDLKAKRSYRINEFEKIGSVLGQHSRTHAMNFNVKFIPKPLLSTSPLGSVQSGLASYSKYKVTEATRFQFPGNFEWPKSVFMLDRCFLLQRVPLDNGKELIVINSHNSAYDDGTLKQQQMDYMKNVLQEEYEKGNYVVVGADWNQCPPNFPYDTFSEANADDYSQTNVPEDFIPNWKWAFDPSTPSNRKLTTPYKEGETFVTLIDFYLVSPNVEITEVKGVDYNFKNSDHQPVILNIKLK